MQSPKHGRYYWCYCTHTKRVCKDFETKTLGEYHDLYVQSNTLLLADRFEKNGKLRTLEKCVLKWQASLKKTKVKWDILTDIDML